MGMYMNHILQSLNLEAAQISERELLDIYNDFTSFQASLNSEAFPFVSKLQSCNAVNSVRWRVHPVGLLSKIVRKRSEAIINKYRC